MGLGGWVPGLVVGCLDWWLDAWSGWVSDPLLEIGPESVHSGRVFGADYDGITHFLQCLSGRSIFRNYYYFGVGLS